MLITVDRDPGYAPCGYLVCRVTGPKGRRDWDTRDDGRTILMQIDCDFPGLASSFGFIPCECGWTDGTVNCPHKTASDMISAAIDFLDDLCSTADERRFIEDPGYFDLD